LSIIGSGLERLGGKKQEERPGKKVRRKRPERGRGGLFRGLFQGGARVSSGWGEARGLENGIENLF